MDFELDMYSEDDFGTLIIIPGKEDGFDLHSNGITLEIRLPLYNHEAKELLELVEKIAKQPSLT